jgi:hypothetical protein
MPPQSPTIASPTQTPSSIEGLPAQLTIPPTELKSKLDNLDTTEQAKLISQYKELISLLLDKDKILFYDNGGVKILNILATIAKALPKKSANAPATSPEFLQNLKQSGYLDTTYGLEGILSLTIPPELKQKLSKHDTAIKAFKEADNSSSYWIWGELEKHGMPLAPLLDNLEVITLNFNNNEEIRKDSNKIIAEMDKLGLRPLTYSELLATGILHPEVNKRNEYLVALGTTHTLGGGLYVPFLDWDGDERSLRAFRFSFGWDGHDRFPCVRK